MEASTSIDLGANKTGGEGSVPLYDTGNYSELQMAGAAFGLTTAFGRYEDKEELSSLTRSDRVQSALRSNDDQLVLRDAFGTRSSRWQRRRLEGAAVTVDTTTPPYRAIYPAYQSDWSFSWTGGAAPGLSNVAPTKALLDVSAERLKASEGFSESWVKRYHNKGERVKLLAARQWYYSQSHWLSWLKEAFATLALREVGPYLKPYPKILASVTAKIDPQTSLVSTSETTLKWADVLKSPLGAVRHASTPSPSAPGWVGDAIPAAEASWVGTPLRRASVFGRSSIDFSGQTVDDKITPNLVLPPHAGYNLRVFLASQFDLLTTLSDSGDLSVGEVFVSRANTPVGLWQDIMSCVAHSMRIALSTGNWDDASTGFRSIVCPGLSYDEMVAAVPSWKHLPSTDMAMGSWSYYLANVVGYSWGSGPMVASTPMTARDLHALYRHLAYTRCVGCLPHGNGPDHVGHVGGDAFLVSSHWTVRVCAAVGLLEERAGCFGRRETYLPSAGALERGLRWMGVRLAKGFDLVTGGIYGLPRNLPKFGDLSHTLLDASIAAFNDAYARVDGVFIGWSYRHKVDLSVVAEPDMLPDKLEVGTRKAWGLVGELDGAVNEFGVMGLAPDVPSAITKWGGYSLQGLTQAQFATIFVANLESSEAVDVNLRNSWGRVASVPLELYGEVAHRRAGGWSSFAAPLYLWRLLDGELVGDMEVPSRWGSSVGWFVDTESRGAARVTSVARDFM